MSLKKLKKAALVELAEANGIDAEDMNKGEIIEALESVGVEGIDRGGEPTPETRIGRQARLKARDADDVPTGKYG